jgi:hypothetical protein
MLKRLRLIVILLPVLLAAGCDLSEDMIDCGVLRLNYRYAFANGNEKFSDYVKFARIYVFDSETKQLVNTITPTPLEIEQGYTEIQNPQPGKFTFSAWGSDTVNFDVAGFKEVEMDDPQRSLFRDLWKDPETEIEDFFLMLAHNDIAALPIEGDAAPLSNNFSDLFHYHLADVEVVRGNPNGAIDMNFIRNTNLLEVTIVGVSKVADPQKAPRAAVDDLQVFALARNGRYHWDNTIDEYARRVRYEPLRTKTSADVQEADMKTIHIDVTRHAEAPFELHVNDPATGKSIFKDGKPLDVLKAIMQIKDEQGNYLFTGANDLQEAIDQTYRFRINVVIEREGGELSVKVTINDWEIEFPEVVFM